MTPEPQSSGAVLMVRPAMFGFNPETAATNVFAAAVASECRDAARAEFDRAADRLSRAGVDVLVLDDAPEPAKPDAAFPNNWVSFHGDGTVVLYPMATASRRLERRADDLLELLSARGFDVRRVVDLSSHEQSGHFLEGTGSMVLDRPGKIAFAAVGPRTDRRALEDFAQQLGYSPFPFDAADAKGRAIYHTNVLLALGTRFAVLCEEPVPGRQKHALVNALEETGRALVFVDQPQMRGFACNIIELRGGDGEPLIAMSSAARSSFRPAQVRELESFGTIVDCPVPTIEAVGGGSLRCMIADIHLPRACPAP